MGSFTNGCCRALHLKGILLARINEEKEMFQCCDKKSNCDS